MARLELVTFFRSNGLIKSGDRHQELVFEWGVGGVIKNRRELGRVAMDKTEARCDTSTQSPLLHSNNGWQEGATPSG